MRYVSKDIFLFQRKVLSECFLILGMDTIARDIQNEKDDLLFKTYSNVAAHFSKHKDIPVVLDKLAQYCLL